VNDYRIRKADDRNWVIERKVTNEKTGEIRWQNEGYYGKPAQMVSSLFVLLFAGRPEGELVDLRTSLENMRDEWERVRGEVVEALRGVK